MPRSINEFVKVELRLFNDYRFFGLSEFGRLVYLTLLVFAKQTGNKIPKTRGVLQGYLRTTRSETEIDSAILEIRKNFPNFKQNKYFYYFKTFRERYTLPSPNCSFDVPKNGTEKEKEKEKEKEVNVPFRERKPKPKTKCIYCHAEIPHGSICCGQCLSTHIKGVV